MNAFRFIVFVPLAVGSAAGMDIEWTRMTGQWPLRSSPAVADVDRDGSPEILGVNRGGQVLAWKLDGTAIGAGDDGMVAQLPKRRWTSSPTVLSCADRPRILLGSVEGLMVALDGRYQLVWQHQLSGTTTWARQVPAEAYDFGQPAYAFGDESGTVTVLYRDGSLFWKRQLGTGPCRAPVQCVSRRHDMVTLLTSGGSTLHALDGFGRPLWRPRSGRRDPQPGRGARVGMRISGHLCGRERVAARTESRHRRGALAHGAG